MLLLKVIINDSWDYSIPYQRTAAFTPEIAIDINRVTSSCRPITDLLCLAGKGSRIDYYRDMAEKK
jgi:hypothetical protein